MPPLLLLAGDAGGTNARFAFYEASPDGAGFREAWTAHHPSTEFASLEEIVARVVADSGLRPAAMSVGIAGPVIDGECKATNLPWIVRASELARAAGLFSCGLINDLEANAWGLAALGPASLATLQEGVPDPSGTQALISAGTGLGEALLVAGPQGRVIGPSEGGHASFAPGNDEEDDLLRWLRARHGHVSWERVVSGMGLVAMTEFLAETGRERLPPALKARLADDGAVAVSEAAEAGEAIAVRVMRLFAKLYGAEAGNLALKALARGGVFLGGGIAPRNRRWLEEPGFLAAFLDKGRMRPVLERIPVRIVLDDGAALLGAARHAATTA